MLRAKQIGTLSQCARSFYLSGSRCNNGDSAPCASTEDENHASRRQSKSTNTLHKQQKPLFLSTPAGFSTHKSVITAAVELPSDVSASQLSPTKVDLPNSKACSKNAEINPNRSCLHFPSGDVLRESKFTVDHLVKLGPTPSTSEAVSCNASITVKHAPSDPQSFSVDFRRPISAKKSSDEEPQNQPKYCKVQTNSSNSTSWRFDSPSSTHSGPPDGSVKSGKMKFKQNWNSNCMKDQKIQSKLLNVPGHRLNIPQSGKFHSDSFISAAQSADDRSSTKGSSRFQPVALQSSNMQSMNSMLAIEQYYRTLQQQKWGPSTEVNLNNLNYKLDAFQANQVLKLLRDHSLAFGFFKWLKCQPGFKHDDHTYTTMIGILGQARQFKAMTELLEEMIRDGCLPTVVTYNRIIHAYGRANFIVEAVNVFDKMQELGYVPDLVTYCTLIDIHAKAGYLNVALNLYKRMQEVGLYPDTFTYSVMVNCLGKGGHLTAAQKMFVEMVEKGCTPNLVTYNIMIALEAKARNYHNAVKLYRNMQAVGFRPDKVTYSIVMDALGHCGYISEAELVFVEMKRDWVPDEPVYGLLVDLWGKAGNVERAQAWYQAMINEGLRPNTPTCNSLLSAYLRAQRFFEAREILVNMIWMGLVPSLQTYTLLLSCFTDSNSKTTSFCCEMMAITGHPAHTFLLSLPDADVSGKNVKDHASNFFDLVHSEDRESKRGIVDALVDFLHKSGLKEEAGLVWEVAAQRNVYPDSLREKSKSYWLINLHVMSEGTAVTALSRTLAWFQRRLMDSGTGPRRIDIVTGWGRRSRITGSSLVRKAVQDLLLLFQFPFTANGSNSGCFVGCGEALSHWLMNSYVGRMHLL
ncbi:Pentatricopeptide repeat-containing protein [Apostasia shenzhenica]|uniref:Pentatricopeptide repeat-containing protein n=1 Tax=Apostasia shenzhenica TaxID=1088818 RepID=A0A2I0AMP5_9ASPA|nr:Pentatricopeptide repeat-containing protein [Apostasia shenzhenica]